MPANSCRNRLSTCWPCGVCMHLGVVLHAGQPTRAVLERRHRGAGAGGDDVEPVGRRGDRVAVAHPHRLDAGQIRMQLSRQSLSARCGRTHWCRCARPCRPAPVPSPESRSRCRTPARPRSNNAGIELRGAVGVHAGRATGQHDGLRVLGLDLVDGRGVRDDLRVHPRLADPPRDQLRILRAEVDHEHRTGRGRRLRFHGLSLVALNGPACRTGADSVLRTKKLLALTASRVCPKSALRRAQCDVILANSEQPSGACRGAIGAEKSASDTEERTWRFRAGSSS